MKKTNKYFAIICTGILAIAGCQKPEMENAVTQSGDVTVIEATLSDEGIQTKTQMTPGSDADTYKVVWKAGDAVQINDQVGALFIVGYHGNFFGNFKEVFTGRLPVNEIYSSFVFVGILFDFGTVFQKLIDLTVGRVQALLQIGGCFDQFLHSAYGNGFGITVIGQPLDQFSFINIAVFAIF